MIPVSVVFAIIAVHFLADFVLQSDWMAKNKSSNFRALLAHVGVYTLVLMVFGFNYAIVNGILHILVDAITSRINKHLWNKGEVHWFFVGVGADQLVHYLCLILTYMSLFS